MPRQTEPAMKSLHLAIRAISNFSMAISIVVLVLMVGLILAEVVARNIFGMSTHVMNELVGYGVAVTTMLALGQSLERGTLIRMNLLLILLRPDSLLRRGIEIACVLLALFAASIALYFFIIRVSSNYSRGFVSDTILRTPLWLPETFVIAGLVVLLLQLFSYLLLLFAGGPYIGANPASPEKVKEL